MAGAEIGSMEEGFGRIRFQARADKPAFVVVSNVYYPGFRAWINGLESRIHKVDGALQGLELPPGESEVVIGYAPFSFRIGMWYRLAGTIFMILILAAAWRKAGRR